MEHDGRNGFNCNMYVKKSWEGGQKSEGRLKETQGVSYTHSGRKTHMEGGGGSLFSTWGGRTRVQERKGVCLRKRGVGPACCVFSAGRRKNQSETGRKKLYIN